MDCIISVQRINFSHPNYWYISYIHFFNFHAYFFHHVRVFQHSVEKINLSGEYMVDGEWLAYLGAFRCLHSLKLADCRGVSSSSIWPLAGMTVFGLTTNGFVVYSSKC